MISIVRFAPIDSGAFSRCLFCVLACTSFCRRPARRRRQCARRTGKCDPEEQECIDEIRRMTCEALGLPPPQQPVAGKGRR